MPTPCSISRRVRLESLSIASSARRMRSAAFSSSTREATSSWRDAERAGPESDSPESDGETLRVKSTSQRDGPAGPQDQSTFDSTLRIEYLSALSTEPA